MMDDEDLGPDSERKICGHLKSPLKSSLINHEWKRYFYRTFRKAKFFQLSRAPGAECGSSSARGTRRGATPSSPAGSAR